MRTEKEITILGAGLAGLACAYTLKQAKIPYRLIETSDRVGGRIKTDIHAEGFLLDRGFQVLLNSYPELPRFLDLKELNLQTFGSGAKIFDGNRLHLLANPLKHPAELLATLTTRIAKASDKIKVLGLIAHVMTQTKSENKTTLQFLIDSGFSQTFIDFFWRPFFAGIYLDPELSVDSEFFLFLLRCFALGSVSVPAQGMEAIPKQMAARLSPVQFVGPDEIETVKQDGPFWVQAFNPDLKSIRSGTTYYFATEAKIDWGKWLILVPSHLNLNVNHAVHLSAVAPAYAPRGQHLISATVVRSGPSPLATVVASELERIAGLSLNLRHLRTDAIERALPAYDPLAPQYLKHDFGYECGDHLSSPSSNGALKSGRLAAEAIISERHQF